MSGGHPYVVCCPSAVPRVGIQCSSSAIPRDGLVDGSDVRDLVQLYVPHKTGIVQWVGLDGIDLYKRILLGQIDGNDSNVCANVHESISLSENGCLREVIVIFHPPDRIAQGSSARPIREKKHLIVVDAADFD